MKLQILSLLLITVGGCRQSAVPVNAQYDQPGMANIQEIKRETALDKYLARAESAYRWSKMKDCEVDTNDGDFNLRVVSQTWQRKPWTHRLQIFNPSQLDHADSAILNISYGSGSIAETFMGKALANATGTRVVNVFDVPNQPLYGRYEDELIAYSFSKYLQTGDGTWHLVYPMTKAVIKAMDAIQAWSKTSGQGEIKKFIVSGASKRGWTTDLVAAHDRRVIGAIPVVYNNLKVNAQIAHQRKIWGNTSPLISAYKREGLLDPMPSSRARELAESIDPWSYRHRLNMPKLLINATNDGYWAHDALNLYRDDLPGQTDLFYVPNAPHTLGQSVTAAVGSAAAWTNLLLDEKVAPKLGLKVEYTAADSTFSVSTDAKNVKVRLWLASSETRDFRKAKWNSLVLEPQDGLYSITVPLSKLYPRETKHAAAFAEIEIPAQPLPLRLSSKMWVKAKQLSVLRSQES